MPDSNAFVQSAAIAMQDIQLQTALDRALGNATAKRQASLDETTDAAALRQQGRNAKLRALQDLPEMLEQLEARLTEKGIKVLWAVDGQECNQHVLDIATTHNVRSIVKGKSMATDDTLLNHNLAGA